MSKGKWAELRSRNDAKRGEDSRRSMDHQHQAWIDSYGYCICGRCFDKFDYIIIVTGCLFYMLYWWMVFELVVDVIDLHTLLKGSRI